MGRGKVVALLLSVAVLLGGAPRGSEASSEGDGNPSRRPPLRRQNTIETFNEIKIQFDEVAAMIQEMMESHRRDRAPGTSLPPRQPSTGPGTSSSALGRTGSTLPATQEEEAAAADDDSRPAHPTTEATSQSSVSPPKPPRPDRQKLGGLRIKVTDAATPDVSPTPPRRPRPPTKPSLPVNPQLEQLLQRRRQQLQEAEQAYSGDSSSSQTSGATGDPKAASKPPLPRSPPK